MPLAHQDGGVVVEASVVVVEYCSDETAQRFGNGEPVCLPADDELDEAFTAELLALAVSGFWDAVGVEQQAVSWLELFVVDLDGEV